MAENTQRPPNMWLCRWLLRDPSFSDSEYRDSGGNVLFEGSNITSPPPTSTGFYDKARHRTLNFELKPVRQAWHSHLRLWELLLLGGGSRLSLSRQFCELESQIHSTSYNRALQRQECDVHQDVQFTDL